MPADVNKTIDIQIKADLKEMLRELKRMPNMAGDEAKKMVNQLKRQFQRAEIAAKAQAKAHALANKQMADSTKKATQSMTRDMDKQIKKSKSARTQSRELGASLGSLEDVVSVVSPELGGLAVVVGTLGQAFRTLARAMMTGNPIIMTLIGLTATAAAGYHFFTAATRENEESQARLAEAIKKGTEEIQASKKAFEEAEGAMKDNAGKVNELRLEYQLLTGQISAAEVAEMKREMTSAQFADKAQKDFEDRRHALFREEAANNRMIQQAKDRIKTLEDSNNLIRLGGGYTEAAAGVVQHLNKLEKERQRINKAQDDLRLQGQNRVNDASDEYFELLKNIAIETKRQEDAEKALAKAQKIKAQNQKFAASAGKAIGISLTKKMKDEQDKLNAIEKVGNDARKEADKQTIVNERLRISLIDETKQKIDEQIELEKSISESKIASLEALKQETMASAENSTQILAAKEAIREIDAQIEQEKETAALKEQKLNEQRIKAIHREKDERLKLMKTIVSSSVEGANAVSAIIKNVGGENKKAALVAFRIQQAASLANIAMLTAEKIMSVAPNPFAMAGVGALGALQAGVVLSQSPPEKHMGGMITKGEDTQNITVLSGEAVLDRMTVQRLGGEQGINRLQRGMSMQPEIVIMNPFKHFDRYADANVRRGGSLASMANRKASGGY